MKRRIVPDVISGEQELISVAPSSTARQAAEILAERRVAAALVISDDALVGIITERDLVFRVMAKSLDPEVVTVGDIMTANPVTVLPSANSAQALERMRQGHFRHLPVVDAGEIIGMVSIRDLYEAMASALSQELQNAEALIYGDQYGGMSA